MPPSPKRKVRTARARGDHPEAVVHLALGVSLEIVDAVPAVGVPRLRIREVRGGDSHEAWGGQEDVGGRDDKVGAFDRQGVLDLAHDGVDGRVQAEGFTHDVRVEFEVLEAFVGERGAGIAKNFKLFFVELFCDCGLGGEVETMIL